MRFKPNAFDLPRVLISFHLARELLLLWLLRFFCFCSMARLSNLAKLFWVNCFQPTLQKFLSLQIFNSSFLKISKEPRCKQRIVWLHVVKHDAPRLMHLRFTDSAIISGRYEEWTLFELKFRGILCLFKLYFYTMFNSTRIEVVYESYPS